MPLVTVRAYRDPIVAHVHRAMLEATGIAAFVADDNVIGVQWLYSGAVGGAKLQVAATDLQAASELIEEDCSAGLAALPESESAPADGDLCPACGAAEVRPSSLFRRSLALSLLLELPLFAWRQKWICGACSHSWKRGVERSALSAITLNAEEAVHGERGSSYTVILALLVSWLALLVLYYVLHQPAETW